MWKQTDTGPVQHYKKISAYNHIKATSDKGCNQFKQGGSGEVEEKECATKGHAICGPVGCSSNRCTCSQNACKASGHNDCQECNCCGRTYMLSIDDKTGDNLAYTWCEGRSLGLAMWNSEESYEDMQYITDSEDEDFFTALNNANGEDCNTNNNQPDCDDKLVWKQTKNGHTCSFHADASFTKYEVYQGNVESRK